jgi:hypothetical protein
MRGYYGPPVRWHGRSAVPLVGLELPGTSYAIVGQLNTQIVAFCRAVITACGAESMLVPDSEDIKDIQSAQASLDRTYKGKIAYTGPGHLAAAADGHDALLRAGALGKFWYDEVSPFLTEWQAFHHSHSHVTDIYTQVATGSEVYQTWQHRLDALRGKARSLGVKLPVDATGVPESKGILDSVETILKYGIIGAAGLVGAVVVASIVTNSRASSIPVARATPRRSK